jgi:isopenicillin-N epimerase
MLNIGYGSVKKMLAHKCQQVGAHLREGEITFPLTGPEHILEVIHHKPFAMLCSFLIPHPPNHLPIQVVKSTLRPNTRLAIFDHITSNTGNPCFGISCTRCLKSTLPPGVVMPIKELIEVCHSRGVPVFIDGAHGLGSVPLDLSALNADYYVSNCHKWFCCAPGCAFLYVRRSVGDVAPLDVYEGDGRLAPNEQGGRNGKDALHPIHPLVISHGFGEGFTSNFIWSGYHDYSSVLTFPLVLAFWKRVGWERVWNYNTRLLREAVDLLRSRWHTDVRGNLPPPSSWLCLAKREI